MPRQPRINRGYAFDAKYGCEIMYVTRDLRHLSNIFRRRRLRRVAEIGERRYQAAG